MEENIMRSTIDKSIIGAIGFSASDYTVKNSTTLAGKFFIKRLEIVRFIIENTKISKKKSQEMMKEIDTILDNFLTVNTTPDPDKTRIKELFKSIMGTLSAN